jgi:hypothetical protein
MAGEGVVAVTCSGIHCAGCAGGAVVPVVPLAAVFGLAWIAGHLIEVAIVAAVCGALAVAAVELLARWSDRRDVRRAAARPLVYVRSVQVVTPASQPAAIAPALTVNFYGPDSDMAARALFQAIPGHAGDAITEE